MIRPLVQFVCLECGTRFRANRHETECYFCRRSQAVRRDLLPAAWNNRPNIGPAWWLLVIVLAAWIIFAAAGFWLLCHPS